MAFGVSRRVALLLPLTVALAGCDMSLGHLTGRATDEWTHHYSLSPGGEIRIVNTNGRIEVEGVDGADLEVRAERIARAATDAGARELLPRISIKEDVSPDRVSIETERMSGLMIGAAFEVRYHVRAPKNAIVNVTNTNGLIALTPSEERSSPGRPTAASTPKGSPEGSRRVRPTAASTSTSHQRAPRRSRCAQPMVASR